MNDERARLRAMLEEDTGSAEAAEDLLPVVERLRHWSVPEAEANEAARMIEMLLSEMPRPASRVVRWRRRLENWWPWLLLRAQTRVVRSEIWMASLLVIALGTMVTVMRHTPSPNGDPLPIVMVAPLIAALGVAFIYGPDVDPPLEILLATPVSPRLVLFARLTLVFGFNLALVLAGSIVLAAVRADIFLWSLVLAWLAPMMFLSALAFCISIVSREGLLSGLASFIVWMMQLTDFPSWQPDLLSPAARPWLVMMALLLGMVALWLAGYEERWIGNHS